MSQLALSLIQDCLRTQDPYLDLGCCGLTDALVAEGTEIDIALRKCTHLKTLILSNQWYDWEKYHWINSQNTGEKNFFATHPPALPLLRGLEVLSFEGEGNESGIKDMGFVDALSALVLLDISFNQIRELKGLEQLTNLQQLSIYKNQISELKGLDKLVDLQKLEVSANQINELKGLDNLANLQQLCISANQISELKGLDQLNNLQQLSIFNNQISDIRSLLPFLQRAENPLQVKWDWFPNKGEISIQGNPLTSPPVEVVEQGNAAILEWFEYAAIKDLRPLNECKLIFVGEGSVGKTSLMKTLIGQAFDEKEQTTHGINKVAWEQIQNAKGEKIRVNLWDFGGQHIQHSLHQFFFTKSVIYVVVLSPRNDNKADYWLEQIEKLGCESTILVVYNWKDEKEKQAPYLSDFYELRKKYPHLETPFLLSCKTGEGVEAFKTRLISAILSQEDLNALYPTTWYNIKQALEERTAEKDYISYENYEQICEALDYKDEEKQQNLLDRLDKIGSIVYFNRPILNSYQVLNPDWVTTGAYTVMTAEITKQKKGHINYADLRTIFKEEVRILSDKRTTIKYKENQFVFIIELMREFNLAENNPFTQAEKEYLIPAAFEGLPLSDYAQYKQGGKHYRLLFPSAFEMIIMHKFIARNISKCIGKNYWASGLLIKKDNTFALVETNQLSKIINFWITGENVRGFWEILRNDMQEICKKYHNFTPDMQVYYQKEGKSAFFSYQEMLDCVTDGVLSLPYHPSTRMKNIDVLSVIDLFEDSSKAQEKIAKEKRGGDTYHIHGNHNNFVKDVHDSKVGINKDISPHLHDKIDKIHANTENIQHSLSHLKSDLLAQIGIESEGIKAAISQSSEKQVEVMGEMLRELEKMDNETQQQLWDGFCTLGIKNEAVKNIIEAEIAAAKLTEKDNSNLKLKIGLPFMLQNILGIGLEYEVLLADGNAFAKWAKKWVSRI
ncbi:MAG: COR domain-containing protein [Bacteroidia bacterium]